MHEYKNINIIEKIMKILLEYILVLFILLIVSNRPKDDRHKTVAKVDSIHGTAKRAWAALTALN